MATSKLWVTVLPRRWSSVSPTAGSLGAVVPAPTFEAGSVGPASEEEAHPAINIAIATAIAIQGRYERLGLILVRGQFSSSCTGLISSLTSATGRRVREEA